MSAWHFEDPKHVELLLAAAADWKGTPFRRGSCAKGQGGGADCVCLTQSLLFAGRAIPELEFPRDRKRDYSPHVANDKIVKFFRGQFESVPGVVDPRSEFLAARFAELEDMAKLDRDAAVSHLLAGDVLVMKTGVDLYHLPIVLVPPRFVQCAFPDGVSEGEFNNPQYHEHLVTVFRARALAT